MWQHGPIGSLLCRELESIRRMEQKKKKEQLGPGERRGFDLLQASPGVLDGL